MKRYGILDRVELSDLQQLSYVSLEELCASLREFIIDHVSETGGHLSSNLGIVELAVALEREFHSQKDRIIYDVGHQCYVHKILTGKTSFKEINDTSITAKSGISISISGVTYRILVRSIHITRESCRKRQASCP